MASRGCRCRRPCSSFRSARRRSRPRREIRGEGRGRGAGGDGGSGGDPCHPGGWKRNSLQTTGLMHQRGTGADLSPYLSLRTGSSTTLPRHPSGKRDARRHRSRQHDLGVLLVDPWVQAARADGRDHVALRARAPIADPSRRRGMGIAHVHRRRPGARPSPHRIPRAARRIRGAERPRPGARRRVFQVQLQPRASRRERAGRPPRANPPDRLLVPDSPRPEPRGSRRGPAGPSGYGPLRRAGDRLSSRGPPVRSPDLCRLSPASLPRGLHRGFREPAREDARLLLEGLGVAERPGNGGEAAGHGDPRSRPIRNGPPDGLRLRRRLARARALSRADPPDGCEPEGLPSGTSRPRP